MCDLLLSLALSGSLWLSLALSGSRSLSLSLLVVVLLLVWATALDSLLREGKILSLSLSLSLSFSLFPGRCTLTGLGYCTGLLIGWGHCTCRKSHMSMCLGMDASYMLSISILIEQYG
jgi:hypothetical protein